MIFAKDDLKFFNFFSALLFFNRKRLLFHHCHPATWDANAKRWKTTKLSTFSHFFNWFWYRRIV